MKVLFLALILNGCSKEASHLTLTVGSTLAKKQDLIVPLKSMHLLEDARCKDEAKCVDYVFWTNEDGAKCQVSTYGNNPLLVVIDCYMNGVRTQTELDCNEKEATGYLFVGSPGQYNVNVYMKCESI